MAEYGRSAFSECVDGGVRWLWIYSAFGVEYLECGMRVFLLWMVMADYGRCAFSECGNGGVRRL